jgi:molybdopterin molybdotransferase
MAENMDVRTKGFHKRVPVDKALNILLREIKPLGAERVQLADTLGRVLAQKVVAPHDSPPFSRGAMDGYALKGENTFGASQTNPIYFKLKGKVLTGKTSDFRIHEFEAARIMTGAPVPEGADAVAMFEYVKELEDEIEVLKPVTPGKNISLKGEDVKKGDVLLRKGRKIKPQDVAITAAMGISKLTVYRRPTVAIIATGDELREPGSKLRGAEIYDANSYSLHALVERNGGLPEIYGIVRDDYPELVGAVRKALGADLVLISGATSVGDKDFVPKVLAELGEVLVHGIAMRPGEPTGFGVVDGKLVFMLPGYPVAAIFAYETFVRPALEKMQGLDASRRYPKIRGQLKRKIASELGRRDYVRVKLDLTGEQPMVEPIRTSGSGIISSLVRADGFVVVPENTEGLEQGIMVEVNVF